MKIKSSQLSRLICVISLLLSHSAFGINDSLRTLGEKEFLSIVRQYHPVVRSAGLQVIRAQAGIQQARGAFDPLLRGGLSQKTLEGKQYYQYFSSEISIPTWFGLEIVGGTEDVNGERVNPETTNGVLSYAGAKLNLNSIVMDSRRAILRQAKALLRQSLAERMLAVNSLIYEGLGSFYNWQKEATRLQILASSLENARERARFVRIEYEQRARPAIDTIEAATQILSIEQQREATMLAFQNAGLELNNYLWLPDGSPYLSSVMMVPAIDTIDKIPRSSLEMIIVEALDTHPKLALLHSKMDILNIERKLKSSYLLPKMSVKGMILSKGYAAPGNFSGPFLESNNKIAVEILFPLFLREGRGSYRAAGLKILETNIERDAQKLAIENKIRAAFNDVNSYNGQLRILEELMAGYTNIYNGDRIRFEGGESTLFIINGRQNKIIETAEKMADLKCKQRKAIAGFYYAAGKLQ